MTQQVEQRACRFPGCERPTVPSDGVGRPAEYCDDPLHTRASAWRERQKLSQGPLPVEARPVDAARQRASMITGQVTGMIEHLGQQLGVLVDELRTVGDPEAVEVVSWLPDCWVSLPKFGRMNTPGSPLKLEPGLTIAKPLPLVTELLSESP